MHFVVYGAGAVGGVVGARLALAGVDVTLVARGDHLAAIREAGLTLETQGGHDTVAAPTAASASEVVWRSDSVVLLTVKSQQTVTALDDLVAHAPASAPIVTAQNGVANEREALRRFARVYGAYVQQPCAHVEPGVVVQQSDPVPGIIDLGPYPDGREPDGTAQAISAALRSAGFASEARADIMAWKHRKLITNLGNGIQACYRPGPEADELQRRARAEGEAVLAAAGVPVVSAAQDRERCGDLLRGRAREDYHGSTWQSVARGSRTVETDWLNGEVVLLGRLHGVPTPANAVLQQSTNALARSGARPRSLDAAEALAELDEP